MILFFIIFPLLAWAQDFSERSLTVGGRSSYFTDSGKTDNTFLYYIPEYSSETFGEKLGIRKKLKVRVLDYTSSDERLIIDPLDVSLEFFTNNNSFQIGFLRYRFSETFGLQLLDVANPRDYSEFIFNDLSWSKRSVFGMNETFRWDKFQIQFMLTLWSNGDRLPYQNSAFDPTPDLVEYRGGVIDRPWFKDLEYGTRLKYLFENGLDFSFLYYHHFSRPTFQTIRRTDLTTFKAEATHHLVDSLGTSASYVWEDWVIRGDALFTFDDLVQKDLLNFDKENHFQVLAGIDRTFKDFLLGIQGQADFSSERHFFGVRSEYSGHTWWKPQVMFFRNFSYDDSWIQLKSSFEFSDWKYSVTYDNIHGDKNEKQLFGFFRNQDRILLDVNFTY